MPIQRRVLTQTQIDERNALREELARISPQQVDALDKLYSRDEEMRKFILAIHEHFPSAGGGSTEVIEVAKAVGKPFRRTCDLLTDLSETAIGNPDTRRMMLDEAKPFIRFRWRGNFEDLVDALTDKWAAEEQKRTL